MSVIRGFSVDKGDSEYTSYIDRVQKEQDTINENCGRMTGLSEDLRRMVRLLDQRRILRQICGLIPILVSYQWACYKRTSRKGS